ncbi:MAG: DUF4136 domain-containing protein [Pseudomonadota bacterium]|nr:DUF4136 domain-containing protein [Pseudomonadota bacterium]
MAFSVFPRHWRRCFRLGLLRLWLAGFALAWLAACASPITAKVTRFNQWPADAAGSTFSFLPRKDTGRELEQATYERQVQAALEQLGLQRAPAGQTGRFQVDVQTSQRSEEKSWRQPIYENSYVFLPPYRDAAGRIFPGAWAPDPFGPHYMGDRLVSYTLQISSLRLRLLDTRAESSGALHSGNPRTVFEAQAVHEGHSADLPLVLPYLVRAIFDDFPGQNGRVRVVKFDAKTGALLPR